ncbi:TrkH family potassium uptake protein [Methanohalobium sp.]|uniref:TrkH family potassium uptake protein n=1 Tax=Methanohalobium sp. TaxID=2837493 RepID=UPI0025E0E7BE|nr:TrkH family potassium uptake protein [Methanohalobium sp.]
MNVHIIFNIIGRLLLLLGFIMIIPLFVALYYGESIEPFTVAITMTILVGTVFLFLFRSTEDEWHHREGFAIVALGWLFAAIFGSIPYMLDGVTPLNAFFESMSGFTTTGSTVFANIEAHPKGILFWRNMTEWLGGMGIIVLFIAILPKLGVAGRQMFRAEVPGPQEDKLKPRIRETSKILWMVYLVVSIAEAIALKLAGLSVYDAVTHTFTTVSCGGFSPYARSIEAFGSPLVETIIMVFIFISGANFALHYKTLYASRRSLIKDDEFKFYSFVVFSAIALLTLILWRDINTPIIESLRYAAFQVLTITTTTGYATTDFIAWPHAAQMILLILMFAGGCAGSTAGGPKMVRWLLMLKYSRREIFKVIHRRAVTRIKFNKKSVSEDIMQSVISFIAIYFLIFAASSALLGLLGMDLLSSITASIATLGNIGPGLGAVGPMDNFDVVPALGKVALIGNMWMGRLEIFTVFVMLTPEYWKKW